MIERKGIILTSRKPIRIAHVMGKLYAGGVESVVFNYYRAIDKSKFQFDFYYDADSTVNPPKELIEMGARFIKVPPYQQVINYVETLENFFKSNKYIIVHSHINTLGVIPLYAAKKAGVPIRIQHNHSVPGGEEFARNILKRFLRIFAKTNSTNYFACSAKAGRWMFGDEAFNNDEVFVMKNAINFSKYRYTENQIIKLKHKLGLNHELVVGHVGRFTYAKNHSFLLDTFANILKFHPNAKLILVGDGELHNYILKKINRLGLENNVILTGKVPNPEIYYSVMDVLLLPSIFEGLSMTTIEAQAARKNIIVSKAVPKEAVISNGCHFMPINATPYAWAKKVDQVYNNKVIFNNLKDDYDIKKAVKKLESKYEYYLKLLK